MMEHFYNTIPSPQEMIYGKFYTEQVNRMKDGDRFVEVGVYYGRSFSYFIVEMINAGKKFDCVAVDACPWPDVEPGFRQHMAPLEKYFRTIFDPVDSFVSAAKFADKSIDFLWIDANHTYPFVIQDLKCYYPKMKTGGVMSGHDWSDPGVRQAVKEFFGENFEVDESQDLWRVTV